MISDDTGSEELLLGLGAMVACAVLLLVVFSLLRATLPADRSVALQTCAADVSGDISTVASVAVPYSHVEQYQHNGIGINISSDFVTATDLSGDSFAKPLTVRVSPGRYSCGSVSWQNPAGFREYLNATFGACGTPESPIAPENGSGLRNLLATAGRQMVTEPVIVDPSKPLVIEKQLIYVRNGSGNHTECIPCVFVFQR